MSGIDVHDLAKEGLPAGTFPASSRADFRLYLTPEVHRGLWEHAKKDLSVEICGVLVGRWQLDDNGPFAVVSNHIRCENAASKFAEVTFTHESWAQINREMDTRFENERIIGWYHSYPDFGIFLSDRDCFIQEHFFSSPGQVAYVIDPVRDLEGVFAWRNGKPTPLAHFWIGNEIRTVAASQKSVMDRGKHPAQLALAEGEVAPLPARRQSKWDLATTLLSWIALFLLGYLVSGLQSRWEREMIIEGTVAHYGIHKLMKVGMEEKLTEVREQLLRIAVAADSLPPPGTELSEDEMQTAEKQRTLIANNLLACERYLNQVQSLYGLSDDERRVFFNLVAQKQAELRRMMEAQVAAQQESSSAKTGGDAKTAKPEHPTSIKSEQPPPADSKSIVSPDAAATNPESR
jgi:proteasome lid subunit RPN8/RPN11